MIHRLLQTKLPKYIAAALRPYLLVGIFFALSACGNILEQRLTQGNEAVIIWGIEFSGEKSITKIATRSYDFFFSGEFDNVTPGYHFGHRLNLMALRDKIATPMDDSDAQIFVFLCNYSKDPIPTATVLAALVVAPGDYALVNTVQRAVVDKGLTRPVPRRIYFIPKNEIPASYDEQVSITSDTPIVEANTRTATYIGTFKNRIDVEVVPGLVMGTYPVVRTVINSFSFDPNTARQCLEKSEIAKLTFEENNIFSGRNIAQKLYESSWTSRTEENLSIPDKP